jgi:hypothetical protein
VLQLLKYLSAQLLLLLFRCCCSFVSLVSMVLPLPFLQVGAMNTKLLSIKSKFFFIVFHLVLFILIMCFFFFVYTFHYKTPLPFVCKSFKNISILFCECLESKLHLIIACYCCFLIYHKIVFIFLLLIDAIIFNFNLNMEQYF